MLTVEEIESATPGEKPKRRSDSGGLYLEIAPGGGKWWRLKYRFQGKEKRLALGVYPDVGLMDARERRDAAKQLLAQGIDPAAVRREEKARETAERLAAKDASTVQVSVALDGAVEIWKGRAVVRLKSAEAQAVKDLLAKLAA
jgi:hypothetical protein